MPRLVSAVFVLVAALAAPAARAAILHTAAITPDELGNTRVHVHTIDTATGVITPGPPTNWNWGTYDMAAIGGVIYGDQFGPACVERTSIQVWHFDLATQAVGGFVVSLGGTTATYARISSLAAAQGRLFASVRSWGGPCGGSNRIAEFGPDGQIAQEWQFAGPVEFERIAFAPDGRLFALDHVTTGTRRIELHVVDRATLSTSLVGGHPTETTTSAYSDLTFTPDGELWGIERDGNIQRLRRLDPASGAILANVPLPANAAMRLWGLVSVPDAPVPAIPASWGRLKADYR